MMRFRLLEIHRQPWQRPIAAEAYTNAATAAMMRRLLRN
jgi:hypothetical protein